MYKSSNRHIHTFFIPPAISLKYFLQGREYKKIRNEIRKKYNPDHIPARILETYMKWNLRTNFNGSLRNFIINFYVFTIPNLTGFLDVESDTGGKSSFIVSLNINPRVQEILKTCQAKDSCIINEEEIKKIFKNIVLDPENIRIKYVGEDVNGLHPDAFHLSTKGLFPDSEPVRWFINNYEQSLKNLIYSCGYRMFLLNNKITRFKLNRINERLHGLANQSVVLIPSVANWIMNNGGYCYNVRRDPGKWAFIKPNNKLPRGKLTEEILQILNTILFYDFFRDDYRFDSVYSETYREWINDGNTVKTHQSLIELLMKDVDVNNFYNELCDFTFRLFMKVFNREEKIYISGELYRKFISLEGCQNLLNSVGSLFPYGYNTTEHPVVFDPKEINELKSIGKNILEKIYFE
jgi:hypothetical protein